MLGRRTAAVIGAAAAALIAGGVVVRADAIDGNWCFGDGRTFSISGPQIVTPGGRRITGDYDRHAFSYVVPAPEPGAGGTVMMLLLDEDTVQLALAKGATRDPIETWRRCAGTTS